MGDLVKQNFSMQRKKEDRNVQTCSCGKHKGKGDTSPHELAMIYNWNRQRERNEYESNSEHQKDYLETYEFAHGKLLEDEFIFNTGRFANNEQVQACRAGAPLPWK